MKIKGDKSVEGQENEFPVFVCQKCGSKSDRSFWDEEKDIPISICCHEPVDVEWEDD